MSAYLWLIPVLPLAGFLANGLLKLPKPLVGLVGCAAPAASFALSVAAVLQGHPEAKYFDWITVGTMNVSFGLRVDALSAVMILVVTGVGTLIHVYSIGYMHEDPSYGRYFAYLNLFMFSMLILVLGDSLLLLFVGWEGVGLCSYLLIGFWFKELKNADAGKKAFITNRVGDLGFILGLFCLWQVFGNLDFDKMDAAKLAAADPSLVAAAAGLLFIGATGKSAQIPLYVWLPDAMAGPTPVSALIHAATMVTAGVYMMARLWFVYDAAPGVLQAVGTVAALTAALAGVIAVAQTDIKKVLAYSTVSQLGFMFSGIAAGHYAAGMYHVVTHAFFKALLFLGAGAVIHALHGEQDIRKMGGLGRKLPVLAACFVAGALALAGMPFTSGFFSKDGILAAVMDGDAVLPKVLLPLTALLTAFYTTRLVVIVFGPKPHDEHAHEEHHELHKPGLTMIAPLAVLAVLSLGGGLLGGPLAHALDHPRLEAGLAGLKSRDALVRREAVAFLARIHGSAEAAEKAGAGKKEVDALREKLETAHHTHRVMMVVSSLLFLLGAGSALVIYTRARGWLAKQVEGPWRAAHKLVSNKFYVDEIYEVLVIAPIRMGATIAWFVVDRLLIDGLCVNGAGKLVYLVGGLLRRPHTGTVNVALASFLVGALALLGWLLWRSNALNDLWTAGFSR